MRLGKLSIGAALSLSLLTASAVLADADQAKKYVEEAKTQLEQNSIDEAKSKLELAEAELDGVADADKAPITASIAEVRKQVADKSLAGNKEKYTRDLDSAMTDAEGAIGNQATWAGVADRINDIFNNADAKAAIPDELAKAQKKYATFKKLNDKKVGAILKDQAEAAVKDLETFWGETKPKIVSPPDPGDKQTAIDDTDRKLTDTRASVAQLPADSDDAKAFNARIDKVGAEYTQLALADKVKDKLSQIKGDFDSYKDEWTGWEQETTGPTFAEYKSNQGDEMDAYKSPMTKNFVNRSNYWLKNRAEDDDYKKLQSAAEIKAYYDKVVADRNTALAKMEKFADSLLSEMEKAQLDPSKIDAVSRFQDQLKNNIEGSDKLEAYNKRAQALIDKVNGKVAVGNDAAAAFYKDSTAKATAGWPAMKEKYTITEGFDPNAAGDFVGKFIVIHTDNLMGYKFNPGDFPFATTLSGNPIACKYDPAVAAAVKDVESKMGRAIGDSDDDGKWEIICEVTGKTGKLSKRVEVEGKIKDDMGNTATVTGEKAETVDAPILTIVAAHAGPLAISSK